ncbi:MAG: SDR family oxidoreductase [Pyrinomonadaceae bacterium]
MKTTLITGASGGIGEAFARRLASEKHNLCLVARSGDKLSALCDELKSKHDIEANFVALDLTAHQSDAILFEETEKRGLQIEWLINNAGFGNFGDFANNDLEKELAMIDLNVRVLVALTHRYLQPMRARKGGVIINVSSTASFQPVPFMATYAATKAFVTSFSEALWEENRQFGIKVLALCPGGTETNFFNAAGVNGEKLPMRGLETPEAVVETAMQGIAGGDSHVISGWGNYFLANAGNIVPNWLIARTIGSFLRSRAEKSR